MAQKIVMFVLSFHLYKHTQILICDVVHNRNLDNLMGPQMNIQVSKHLFYM